MITDAQIKKLEDIDSTLIERLERAKKCIESGEYDHAKIICRNLEDMLNQANRYANQLADEVV